MVQYATLNEFKAACENIFKAKNWDYVWFDRFVPPKLNRPSDARADGFYLVDVPLGEPFYCYWNGGLEDPMISKQLYQDLQADHQRSGQRYTEQDAEVAKRVLTDVIQALVDN